MSENDDTNNDEPETEPDADERPDIDEDEQAEFAGELEAVDPEDIEADAGAADPDEEGDETDGETDPDTTEDTTPERDRGGSWGEYYVTALTTTSNVIIDEYADDPDATADEALAYDLDLDKHFNAVMEDRGFGEDMPPEQALLIGSFMYVVITAGVEGGALQKVLSDTVGDGE